MSDAKLNAASPPTSPLPSPTLPKGGGAIRDLGEKFSANPATGAGSLSIPIFTSPGRSGFHPELTLEYDTGKGNGPFGIGWSLSTPRVARRTDKGLPRYDDSDTFVLSGAEDLVPAYVQTASGWVPDEPPDPDYFIRRYRPRVDTLYARIERWTRRSDGDIHWRSVTTGNVTSIFGRSATARIADPRDPRRVFSWLLEETRDGKGNVIGYEYKLEDQANLDASVAYERPRPVANAYLERISYGNRTPDQAGDWLFAVLFDYGEHDLEDPIGGPIGLWPARQDPFSDFRATFEVRTYRLCRRILMLHDFAELGDGWTIVRSTELGHTPSPIATYLTSVTQRGWLRNADGTYDRATTLPPIELGYSQPAIDPELRVVEPDSLDDLPAGIDGRSYQLVDLDSEGLPGVVTQQPGALYYARNGGGGRFDRARRIATRPSIAALGGGLQQLTDLDGSGEKSLVQLGRSPQGYFERDDDSWRLFRAFESLPTLDWSGGELKYLDLDGDGLPDILKPEGDLFRWWGSLGRRGYGPERRVPQPRDDDDGPHVVWTDRRQAILAADMTGDGLPDLVRIRDGSVDYWPNLGYGRFGQRVVMRNAPRFAPEGAFNPIYLHVADVDGSGTADLLYLEDGVARIWMNQSGNAFAAEQRVGFPSPADATVTVADLLGKGTSCLVWSSPLPGEQGRQLRYIDLMSGTKPHLLVAIDNHLGATTRIEYRPSTEYYLEDRRAGRPWGTRLAFPVHVVAHIETNEAVTGTRLVSTYRYRHGHYDGVEREFAGFAFVEQDDAETVLPPSAPPETYTPPRRTRSWMHTGAFVDAQAVSTALAQEYSAALPQLVADSVLAPDLSPQEAREAVRALRGRLLRREVYGLDGSPLEPSPFSVGESNFEVRRAQPTLDNRHAVFCVHPRESLTAHTERNAGDARLEHDLTLTVDDFGNVRESVHLAYPRRSPAEPGQEQLRATLAQRDYVVLADAPDHYRVDLLRESRTWELTGMPSPASGMTYGWSEVKTFVAGDPSATPPRPAPIDLDFSVDVPPAVPARRLIERMKNAYLGDQPANHALLALGLATQTRRAALSALLVNEVYHAFEPDANARRQLLLDAGYVDDDGLWWVTSGQTDYPVALFYQAGQFVDPFGVASSVEYDAYARLVKATHAAVGTAYETTTTVDNDYRVLTPSLVTDPNGNRTRAAFDALGRVTATWLMGKPAEPIGDDDAHPSTRIEYHLEAAPSYTYIEKREAHWLSDPANEALQRTYVYSDGLGRVVLTKKQAEPDDQGERWIGSGRVVFDNKGNPVKKYEPYFSRAAAYDVVFAGVSQLLHYDALDRIVRTDNADGSYTRVELAAWAQVSRDENDTVGEPNNRWYADATTGPNATPESRDAATKALAHNDTPTTVFFDPLGRIVITQQHNGLDGGVPRLFRTTLRLDLQGNQRSVTDARGLAVSAQRFDMLARKLATRSTDAGDSTVLFDAFGAVAREWNANAVRIEREYDPLRRPRRVWVTTQGQRRLAQRTFYGETLGDGAADNLRGRVYCQLDGAGLVTNAYDFRGNLRRTTRQVASRYDQPVDWPDLADPTTAASGLQVAGVEAEAFATTTEHDALDRITRLQVPSGASVPTYNRAGLLEAVALQLAGASAATPLVTNIDYNEKSQRTKIVYAHGGRTEYGYDPSTFRLTTVETFKTPNAQTPELQALAYTYDPVGNITTIADGAQQTYFVGNSKVSPTTKYTYDAVYRLINAQGREHAGQAVMDQTWTPDDVPIPSANDPQAVRNYAQDYDYDAVGNFLSIVHRAFQGPTAAGWTRTYDVDAASNRVNQTQVGDGSTSVAVSYAYDLAGNIVAMQSGSLPTIDWDYRNQLVHASSSRGESHFAYDASGERVRKVLVNGDAIKERIYLGAYEVYRERSVSAPTTIALERRTLHVQGDRRRIALVELLVIGMPSTATNKNDGPAQLVRYQLDNHLGSALLELDGNGDILSYEEYHPYGTTAYRATAAVLDTNPKRYSFIGKERDEGTGLTSIGVRAYASWIARWISADPAGPIDGFNLFAYAKNNPIRRSDPRGTDSDDDTKPPQTAPATGAPATTTTPTVDIAKLKQSKEYQAYREIEVVLNSGGTFDLEKGFEALKNSYKKVPLRAQFKDLTDKGKIKPIAKLDDAAEYVDENNNPQLISYKAKGSVNQFRRAALSVPDQPDTPGDFRADLEPGIVVSQAILQELGGGDIKQNGAQRAASVAQAEKSVLPPGSLGLVVFPNHPAVAAPFADAGPFKSAGEVSEKTARLAGVARGSGDAVFTDFDDPTVTYYVLTGTKGQPGVGTGSNKAAQLTPDAVKNRTVEAVKARLQQRADELFDQVMAKFAPP